ncbi:MAG: hypothetical protein ACKV22_09145 [Bryobacteraceae bacterium]
MDERTLEPAKIAPEPLEELAIRQGVVPVNDFDALMGHPSAEDESAEEFSSMLREWRREGFRPARPR